MALKILAIPFFALALLPMSASASDWPELFSDAVSGPAGPVTLYSYEASSRDVTGDEVMRYRFTPGATPEFEFISLSKKFERNKDDLLIELEGEDDDIWCDDVAHKVAGDVRQVAEDEDTVTFAFQPTDPLADEDEAALLEKSVARVTVNKASRQISDVVYELTEPFKPAVVAKINAFKLEGSCVAAPSGRPYFQQLTVSMDLSTLGEREWDVTVQTVENLQEVN